MMLDYPGVYFGKCLVHGKIYVGSSKRVLKRIRDHKSALARGNHRNLHLQASYAKHGAENFRWYVASVQPENLFAEEGRWIKRRKSSDPKRGYNKAYPVRLNEPNPIASDKMKLYWEDPEYRESWLQDLLAGSRKVSKLLESDPEFVAMISQIRRGMWTPELKQKLSEQAVARYKDISYRKEHLAYLAVGREVLNEKRQDSEFVASQVRNMVVSKRDPEERKKQAQRMANLWKDPEFKAKQTAAARERITAYNIKRARIRDSLNNSEK